MKKKNENDYSFPTLVYKIAVFILVVFISFCAFIFFPLSRNYFDVALLYPDLVDPPKLEEKINWNPINANLFISDIKNVNSNDFQAWLNHIPGLKKAILIKCGAESETPQYRELPHYNDALCAIYPIEVPAIKKCGVSVNGEKKYFVTNKWIVCDMSRPSFYYNNHMVKSFVVLVLYIERPENIPKGTSYVFNSLFPQ
jgi:hypothetical protein